MNSADGFLSRLRLAHSYRPDSLYSGHATLIRSSDNGSSKFSKDYDLSKVCKNPVQLHRLDCDHRSLILGQNAEIVAKIMIQL